MSDSHEDVRMLLGAYVLGGLGDTDLGRVQDHLPTCATCRDELASLAGLPGMLRRRPVESQSPANLGVPPQLLPALLGEVAAARRHARRRSGLRLAVAAVTVAALTAGGGALLSRETDSAGVQASFAAAPGSSMSGRVHLIAKPWGTALSVDLAGLPRSGRFMLQTTGRDGAREQAASWGATATGTAKVVGATSLTPHDLSRVAVVAADGNVVAVATPRV